MALSIGQVAELCGVTENRLRAWERRYRLPEPGREENGYRTYSAGHAELLRRMAELVRAGVPPRLAADRARERTGITPEQFVRQFVTRTADHRSWGAALRGALAPDLARAADDWLMPMLRLVGEGWEGGAIGVDQEHLIAARVMGLLGLAGDAAAPGPGPVVLAGLPAGARHEIGILTFSTVLQRAGWPARYLGADVPVDAWLQAVADHDAAAVVTAVPMAADAEAALRLVSALRDEFPRLVVAVGGARQADLAGTGGVALGHRFTEARDRFATLLSERGADRAG